MLPTSSSGEESPVLDMGGDPSTIAVADPTPSQDAKSDTTQPSGVDEKGAKPAVTLEDVIRQAASPEKTATPGSPDGEGSQVVDPATAVTDPAADPAKAVEPAKAEAKVDDKDLPFHSHPRWKEVLAERNAFKASHEQLGKIESFISNNQLSNQEVAQGFEIMALMKHDPKRALEMLTPAIEALEIATGKRLLPDIAAQVDDGTVSEQVGRELSLSRIEKARLSEQAQAAEARVAETQQGAHVRNVQTAVTATEQELSGRDPDYARKQPFVMDRVRALIGEQGYPRSTADAQALVKRAYDETSTRMKQALPQRKPVGTVTSGNSSTSASPAPKTLFEVIQRAAAQ